MSSLQRGAVGEAAPRRISASDLVLLLLFAGWCVLGIVKISHDVWEYRAQQAADVVLAARYPEEALRLFTDGNGALVARVPHDPALGRWLLGEILGYVITLAVVAVGSRRAGRPRVSVRVKWTEAPRRRAVARERATPRSPRAAAPGNVAADRLSAIVWSDRVVRQEKELA